ncbi:MAG TPA: D-glycerate dehydrogenase [Solirubrobacterales bacterium]|nr:D-glycerate dehydrogenase [Solirubrobacterales bacterium]
MSAFAVTSRIPEPALELLAAHGTVLGGDRDGPLPLAELAPLLAEAEVAVTLLFDRVDEDFLTAAPRLCCVCNVAVGYDNVDLEAAARRGVAVTNTPGVLDDATADLTMALLLAAARRLGEGERLIRAGQPWAWGMGFMLGSDLAGKRLGIVGLGAIGSRVARRARSFGMSITYSGRRESPFAAELEAERQELDDLLRDSDFVSLHCPLTAETRHLLGARELGLMKPSAVLVNTARGPVVDEAALAEALRAGQLRAAALDVFEHEPAVHPGLLELDQAVLLPHLGSATVETRLAMAKLAAENAIAAASGAELPTPVSVPEGWPAA